MPSHYAYKGSVPVLYTSPVLHYQVLEIKNHDHIYLYPHLRAIHLLGDMEYILLHILQVNLLTRLYFIKILWITSNISHQWIKL